MRPALGCSRPATERRSVVLPLPDAPSSATTSPGCSVIDTPFRMGLLPYERCRSSTVSGFLLDMVLFMEAYSETQCDGEAGADEDDVDERQRGDLIDRTRTPQRHQHRADHFRAIAEQVHTG